MKRICYLQKILVHSSFILEKIRHKLCLQGEKVQVNIYNDVMNNVNCKEFIYANDQKLTNIIYNTGCAFGAEI